MHGIRERRKTMGENLPDTNVGNIEYIRKQDAVDEINVNADGLEQNGGIPYAQGARAMAIVVEQMSPADVVPVVRCDDCKYYGSRRWCELHSSVFDDNAFCSYGERKE